MSDETHMRRALELAKEAAEAGEVPVGAVIIDPETGETLGEGRNRPIGTHDPTAHAEIVAIRAAAARVGNYRLTGLDLYVTLEPCAMCAGAISFARLGRVIFAASDEKGGAVINGPRFFEQKTCHWRPDITQDPVHAAEAASFLQRFFKEKRK
ncbi:MAG: nucleoside deaminase [Henriciella sp.]|uniref:nucleoside deaminase n=1 Tax=Henriciella sp. TaxID=1968823 RepID=UPI003C7696C9